MVWSVLFIQKKSPARVDVGGRERSFSFHGDTAKLEQPYHYFQIISTALSKVFCRCSMNCAYVFSTIDGVFPKIAATCAMGVPAEINSAAIVWRKRCA